MSVGLDNLGEYRLANLIRAGQTCQVWEARCNRKSYALKILQPEFRLDRDEISYLKHELEVGQDLHHPSIIEVYDFQIERKIPFLIMEFHAGTNVKMLIRQGMESYGYMVPSIIKTASTGLQYLHEKGWVHRDIKPDNFLVDQEGEAKLIDFALAERIRTGFSKFFGGKSRVAGTRSYMAPEQIRGQTLDARADVYAFGCTLFELVTGRLPFTAASPEELLRKHIHAPIPSAMAHNKNVTQDFNDLVLSMMAKKPGERPESMDDVLRRAHAMRVFRMMPKRPATKPTES